MTCTVFLWSERAQMALPNSPLRSNRSPRVALTATSGARASKGFSLNTVVPFLRYSTSIPVEVKADLLRCWRPVTGVCSNRVYYTC